MHIFYAYISSGSRISQKGCANPRGGLQQTIWPIFPDNCTKMEKIWPRRAHPLCPLRSTAVYVLEKGLAARYHQLCIAAAAEVREVADSSQKMLVILHKVELLRILLCADVNCVMSCFASSNKFIKVNNNLAFISTDVLLLLTID